MTVRAATPADLPLIRHIADVAYAPGYFEQPASDAWVLGMIASPKHLVLIGMRCWIAASVSAFPWAPSRLNGALLVAASLGHATGELLSMVRAAAKWARELGAARFYLSAATGVDFGGLAKRIGARLVSPTYVLEM